ncbi:MAG TPA: ATP-binding protein [Acetobacteraceae bacterium]|nr:ATP-binding protein [Acetobacteraceae bacterium]
MTLLARLSLKARLLVGAVLWIGVTLLATGLVLTALFSRHVERRFDAELATHLDQLLASLQETGGAVRLVRPMTDPRFQRPYAALYWQVDLPDGSALRSRSLWDSRLALPNDTPADGEMHRHLLAGPDGQHLVAVERKVSLPGRSDVIRAAVAGDLGVVHAATSEFARTAAIALGTLALGLMLSVVVLVLGTLRPLTRLQRALAAVRLGEAQQVAGDFPAEVQPLVNDLNLLLRHDAAVLARARTEAGNLAHELKTPLAIIANAMSGTDAATVQEQIVRMRRRIDYALTRARAAASGNVLGAITLAGPRLQRLTQAMRTLYGPNGIAIELADQSDAPVQVDARDFDEIVGNLLDNACKWARSRVRLSASQHEGMLRLAIEDDGPGLPHAERALVFERGRKLDEATPGSGLGLSIVRDLLDAYAGSIRLEDTPLGGLCAVVLVPLAQPSVAGRHARIVAGPAAAISAEQAACDPEDNHGKRRRSWFGALFD